VRIKNYFEISNMLKKQNGPQIAINTGVKAPSSFKMEYSGSYT
jgi:hypothetical protein